MHEHRQEIRFSDIDAMGHVNNAVYLNYLEQARISFFRALLGRPWDWESYGIIVGRNAIDYISPVRLNDNLIIRTYPVKMGNKSFTVHYDLVKILEGSEELCAKAESVLVCFDYHQQKTIEVPDLWRKYILEIMDEAQKS